MCMAVFNKICANADAYLKKYAGGRERNHFCYNQKLIEKRRSKDEREKYQPKMPDIME